MKKKFQVDSDVTKVQKTSRQVLFFLNALPLTASARFDIRLCLEEALINAIKYGSGLRKEVPVNLEVETGPKEIRITVEDRGKGFDVKHIKDCTAEENLFRNRGRGVYLMRRLMDKVHYNRKGNKITMVKLLKKQKK